MQQKKNIKLFILWIIVLSVTVIVGFYKPETNKLDIDKAYFSLKNEVNNIDEVTITGSIADISLQKNGKQWSLNKDYIADLSKINDLLGVLSEVSVRRKAANNVQKKIMTSENINYKISLYANDELIRSFEVAENNQGTLTYFIDKIAYVVNIPGYNYHIADLFKLSVEEWRSPYIFVSNWTTLDKMQINFPENTENNFEIIYDNLGYFIPTIDQLDTAVMYDYMEKVSFLRVQSYLPSIDTISKPPDLNIIVKDVGDQQMLLNFYIYKTQTLGFINNQEWAIFDPNQVNSLLKSPQNFSTKE